MESDYNPYINDQKYVTAMDFTDSIVIRYNFILKRFKRWIF